MGNELSEFIQLSGDKYLTATTATDICEYLTETYAWSRHEHRMGAFLLSQILLRIKDLDLGAESALSACKHSPALMLPSFMDVSHSLNPTNSLVLMANLLHAW